MTTEIPNTGIALVKFGAEWCGPCKVIEKAFEDLSSEIRSRSGHEFEGIQFIKIDIDKEPDLAKGFGIKAVPTTMIFKDGKNIATKLGALILPGLNAWLRENTQSKE